MRLRHQEDSLRFGALEMLTRETGVLAFSRTFKHERIECYFNLSERPVHLTEMHETSQFINGQVTDWTDCTSSLLLEPWTWVWRRICSS